MTLVTKIIVAVMIIDVALKLWCLARNKTIVTTSATMATDVAIHALLVTLLLLGY